VHIVHSASVFRLSLATQPFSTRNIFGTPDKVLTFVCKITRPQIHNGSNKYIVNKDKSNILFNRTYLRTKSVCVYENGNLRTNLPYVLNFQFKELFFLYVHKLLLRLA
jgi:hypothetical protein